MIPIPAQTQTHLSKPPSPPPSCQPARRLPSCRPEEGSVSQCCVFLFVFLENGDFVYLWQLDITPWCVVEATGLRVKYQLKGLHLKQKSSSSTKFRVFSLDIKLPTFQYDHPV